MVVLPHRRKLFRSSSGSSTDPYFSNVVLLLHFNGLNNGTTFIDSSSYARTMIPVSNSKISTANSKFGGSSLLVDGSSYIYTVDATELEFESGDFTIECFCNVSSSSARTIMSRWASTGGLSWFISAGASGNGFYLSDNGSFPRFALPLTSWPSIGSWFHIAVTRSGPDLKLWVDGTQQGSTYNISTGALFNGTSILSIGDDNNSNPGFNGYIDEVRITKGVARYNSNFSPPNETFPDS